jgi:hypothetical protein
MILRTRFRVNRALLLRNQAKLLRRLLSNELWGLLLTGKA